MPLRSFFFFFFGSSRYLDSLPRYKGSMFPQRLRERTSSYEWARDLDIFPGNAYYVFPGIVASVARLEFGVGR